MSRKVNETSIPYSTNYLYVIYCVTTREYHGGGGLFNSRATLFGAKFYKSSKTASRYAARWNKSIYSEPREFVVVEYSVKATRFFRQAEQEELLNE